MKQTKSWFTPLFVQDDCLPKKIKTSKENTKTTTTKTSTSEEHTSSKHSKLSMLNSEDWMTNFDPKTTEDLAVHSKKVQEVDGWFRQVSRGCRGDMLLISGPVGSGKTATVNVLAAKHGMKITEWITPVDLEIPADNGMFNYREKESTKFKDFLITAANFTSVLQSSVNSNKLVLVEDYPNVLLRNPSQFTEVLQKYKERARSPLVFVCSDCYGESRDTALGLFTNTLKEQFQITHITFNNVSATGLKSALKRVTQIISSRFSSVYNTPSAELVECVVNSSAGDVRSAVLNLHFASLKGMNLKPNEQSIVRSSDGRASKTKKKKPTPGSKFTAIGKDQTVSLLHGVGRVLNPKYVDGLRKQFTHPPLEIIEQFSTQPASFLSFLHENYLPHFANIEHAERAAAALSDADCLLAEWREKFCQLYGLYVAVAGLMVSNKTPVSAWSPVRGPRHTRISYPSMKDIPLLEENQLLNGKVLVTDFKTYSDIINRSNATKRPV